VTSGFSCLEGLRYLNSIKKTRRYMVGREKGNWGGGGARVSLVRAFGRRKGGESLGKGMTGQGRRRGYSTRASGGNPALKTRALKTQKSDRERDPAGGWILQSNGSQVRYNLG